MDSGLNESLIQVAPPLSSETARQRWRRLWGLWGLFKNPKPSKITFADAVLLMTQVMRCAQYQFINGKDNLDPDGQDEVQTETTEEANVPGTMPSESEHSASDSDGQGTISIHPSSQTQTVPDTVKEECSDSINGQVSILIDPSSQTQTVPDTVKEECSDSVRQVSILIDPSSQTQTVPDTVDDSYGSNNVANQLHHGTRVSVWIFSATGLAFEAVSAFFDQVSTPQKPQYSLYGMLLSIVAVLVCILDVIDNAQIQRQGGHASASNILWGILPEIFGLALACIQCISSALQFSFLRRHAANPVKISLVPFLVFFILFAFKYSEGRNRG